MLILETFERRVKSDGYRELIELLQEHAGFPPDAMRVLDLRSKHPRNPFHPFSVFDTVTLGGVAYGQTVLGRALGAAGIAWNPNEAHSAVYDAERTAELFCRVVNAWPMLNESPGTPDAGAARAN